ncbi:MAG: helix-turn-helix domain-containing protein [Selenomonadales bacterium]|nr:helix-turn-helix domain-containing protein [Selenomonadales bacterium]
MAKIGRKGKYSDWLTYEGLLKVEAWARNGLSDEQIAKNIGIAVSTLYEWKNRFPEFSEALKKGKEVVDIEVENALLKRALGHQVVEETKEALRHPETDQPLVDSSGNSIMVVTKQITKNVPPDVTAQIFWLKNRKPDVWRDRKDIDMQANIRNNPYEGLTEDQLKKLAGSG